MNLSSGITYDVYWERKRYEAKHLTMHFATTRIGHVQQGLFWPLVDGVDPTIWAIIQGGCTFCLCIMSPRVSILLLRIKWILMSISNR